MEGDTHTIDVSVVINRELMVAGVTGDPDEGIEFVDSWLPGRSHADYIVIDIGRLVVHQADVEDVVEKAKAKGLNVFQTKDGKVAI